MTAIFNSDQLSKIYTAGQNEVFPAVEGISWTVADKVMFYGGTSEHDFPISYTVNGAVGKRLKLLTPGTLRTVLPREFVSSSAVCREGHDFIFGGRHWKRPGQPPSEDFFMGGFNATQNAFSWQLVEQRGCVPSPRFGHSFVACDNNFILFGGLTSYAYKFDHTNTNMYIFNPTLKTWSTKRTDLPPLAFHTCTYVGDKTAVVVGGLRIEGKVAKRPGCVHVVKFFGDNLETSFISADLFVSGHTAVELGQFIYIFGGYEAISADAKAAPSTTITRIHIQSLLEGSLKIERDSVSPFGPCYIAKQGVRDMLLFQVNSRSVWKFHHTPLVSQDGDINAVDEMSSSDEDDHDDNNIDIPMVDATNDNSLSEDNADNVELEHVESSVPTAVLEQSSSSESSESEDDEPLFCNADNCQFNDFSDTRQQRLNWTQCNVCFDWYHERCIKSKMCLKCSGV